LCDRSQFDSDDEVRDRATFYLNVLNEQQKALSLTYIINGLSLSIIDCLLSLMLIYLSCEVNSRLIFTMRLYVLQRMVLLLQFCLSVRPSICPSDTWMMAKLNGALQIF